MSLSLFFATEVMLRCNGYTPVLNILESGECEAVFTFPTPQIALLIDKSGSLEKAAKVFDCDWISVKIEDSGETIRRYSIIFLDEVEAALSKVKPSQAQE